MLSLPSRTVVAVLGVLAIVCGAGSSLRALNGWLMGSGLILLVVAAWDGRDGVRVTRNVGHGVLAIAASIGVLGLYAWISDASGGWGGLLCAFLLVFGTLPLASIGALLRRLGRSPQPPTPPRVWG